MVRRTPVALLVILAATLPALGRSLPVDAPSFEEEGLRACLGGDLTCAETNGDGTAGCWSCAGDVAVVGGYHGCLQPQMPSDGAFAACLSTGALWGGSALGGVRSDLVSPPVRVNFAPESLTVAFDYEFGTSEPLDSSRFDDTFSATLLTGAGPFPIVLTDTWGTTPSGRGLTRGGEAGLTSPNPECPVTRQTGRVTVKFKRGIPQSLRSAVLNAPIQVRFSVSHQGDAELLSFACVDNLRISVAKSR